MAVAVWRPATIFMATMASYGYPGSGVEGGASNPGYDPGYGGYPSYGGYGIANRGNAAPRAESAPYSALMKSPS